MYIEVKNSVKPLDYSKSMKALEERVEQVFKEQNNELLWILEHKTVYTTGKNFNKDDLIDKKLKIIKTNRGGKITLHSPGQKVIYFVLNLNKRRKNMRLCVQPQKIVEGAEWAKFTTRLMRGRKGRVHR